MTVLALVAAIACGPGEEPVRSVYAPPLAPTVCIRREILHPCDRACRQRRHMRRVIRPYRAWLARLAWCESRGNPRIVNRLGYAGLYQFGAWAWAAAGGHGRPEQASRLEQSYRAVLLRQRYGLSQWECQVGS